MANCQQELTKKTDFAYTICVSTIANQCNAKFVNKSFMKLEISEQKQIHWAAVLSVSDLW